MNYIENIRVNFQKKLINFYEWDCNDNIILLEKIDVFKVDDNTYQDIILMNIKVDNAFLNSIKNSKNICIFFIDIDSICVKFNENGIIKEISKLTLEDEEDLLDEFDSIKEYKLKYKKIKNGNNYSYNTRSEDKIINRLNNYLNSNKEDIETINYLYYEWFNRSSNCKDKYNKLLKSINSEYSIKHEHLYDVIKLLV